MSISGSYQYIVSVYERSLELRDTSENIRIVHTLHPGEEVRKLECNVRGAFVLFTDGRLAFFDHYRREEYRYVPALVDVAVSETDIIGVTASGTFITIAGKKGSFLVSAPPPASIAIGPAKVAHVTHGKLYLQRHAIPHPHAVTQVAVGGGHTVFLNEYGEVYGLGNNLRGQLLAMEHAVSPLTAVPLRLPSRVGALASDTVDAAESPGGAPPGRPPRVVKVSAGHEHTVALDEHGVVWGCGSNYKGQLVAVAEHVRDPAHATTPSEERKDPVTRAPLAHYCEWVRVGEGVVDVHARGNVTLLLFRNGDIQQIGARWRRARNLIGERP